MITLGVPRKFWTLDVPGRKSPAVAPAATETVKRHPGDVPRAATT